MDQSLQQAGHMLSNPIELNDAKCQQEGQMELSMPKNAHESRDWMEQNPKDSKAACCMSSSTGESISTSKKINCRKRYLPKTITFKVARASVEPDGYHWRKYGQKTVKNYRHPRSYFKCAQLGCSMLKTEQTDEDGSMLLVTYRGEHTCHSTENASSETKTTKDFVHETHRKRYLPKTITFKVARASVEPDGYHWRKYGQKTVENCRHPRSYFRCAQPGCSMKKTQQNDHEDDSLLWVTYQGEHTCHSTENASSDVYDDQSSSYLNKRPKAMFSSADRKCPSPNLQENLIEEGVQEVLDECMESSKKAFHSTSAEYVEMPSYIEQLDAFEDINESAMSDAECSIMQETELPAKSVCMTPSPTLVASLIEPIENSDGIQLLLTLENTKLGESIFVGAVVHAIPSEFLEFYFFNAKDMAICVGVGLPQAKVILHDDLSITIEETSVSERDLKDTWKPFLSDSSCHLVMKVKMEAPGMQVNGDDHVQAFVSENGETLSRLFGVGFDCGSQYVDETYDAAEVSWPLLYDMALFILTTNDVQCNETKGKSSAQGSGSFQGHNPDNNMVHKLQGKHDSVFNHGNLQGGGGDGDEDEFGCNHNPPGGADGDDPPVVLRVTVHPLTKCDILETQVKPYGLDGASIAPKLVFEFCQNRECNRISIKTQTRLELASQMDVFYNTNLFGWYHTGIQISFGCEDTEGHPQSGRMALLKQNSCRILNPITSYKYTTAKSITSSKADTYSAGGQAGLKVSNAWLGGIELQGSSSGSRMHQVAASNGENIEIARECICKGFSFRDSSSTEYPARANFLLFYPLQNLSIWSDREFLQGQGLFATIEPCIEGTWIPLNGLDASPYLFKAARSLKLHAKVDGLQDRVVDYKQEYVLPFYVNHAMSHLKSQRSKHIELFGNQQFVPNVLRVGSVY